MSAENKTALEPDRASMLRHLEHLFGGDLDGCQNGWIELAWNRPTKNAEGKYPLENAEWFRTDQFEELVDRACQINSVFNQNVYIGAALRQPDAPPFGRSKKEDFYALTSYYCDLDDEDAAAHVAARYQVGVRPTCVVVTGRHPYTRAQLWFRLETPDRDKDSTEPTLKAIAYHLGGDKAVWNCDRVMRLGGSLAWPLKEGRILERTEVAIPDDGRPRLYFAGQIQKAYPAPPEAERQADDMHEGVSGHLSAAKLIERSKVPGKWHPSVLALVAHWIGRGWSDAEILATAAELTTGGYTRDQTRATLQTMINGGRAKWHKPNTDNEFEGQFDSDTGEFKEVPDDGPDPFAISTLLGVAPPRTWLVQDWLPARTVTALYGDGGMGKTLLAQQLAAAYSLGGVWCGLQMPKGNVLCVLCEDDRDEIWRRQDSIDKANGVGMRSEMSGFYLWPRVGFDSVLENFDRDNLGKTTAFYDRLDRQLTIIKPGLLVLDTAADLFGGNEIIRNQVNQFIKAALGKFVVKHDLTILLLAHPSLSGITSGTGSGGSTGWNNSVRSRWYLEKPEDGLPLQRTLTRKKANYAASGDDQMIKLVWENGVLTTEPNADTVDKIALNSLKVLVWDAIRKAWDDGIPLGTVRSSRPAKDMLPRLVTSYPPAMVMRAFLELERDGYLSNNHGNTHKRGYRVVRHPRTGEFVDHGDAHD